MSTPNIKSLKRVFCVTVPDRNKVSIPIWVSGSTVIKEQLNSVGDWPAYYTSSLNNQYTGIFSHYINKAKHLVDLGMPVRHKHQCFSAPRSLSGTRMIGGGRDYLGRWFVVIDEAETGDRKQPGLAEFDNGEQVLYLPVECDLSEGRRYRLDGGWPDTIPPDIQMLTITEKSECGNND